MASSMIYPTQGNHSTCSSILQGIPPCLFGGANVVVRMYTRTLRTKRYPLSMNLETHQQDQTTLPKTVWQKQVDAYVKQKVILEYNIPKEYLLILGQCTDVLREKLVSLESYKIIFQSTDIIALLLSIKTLLLQFKEQNYGPQSLHEARRNFYNLTQIKEQTTQDYSERFNNAFKVIEHRGGNIGVDRPITDQTLTTANPPMAQTEYWTFRQAASHYAIEAVEK